jgi:hypothetical protein
VQDGLFHTVLDVNPAHFNVQPLRLRVEVGAAALGCEEILPAPFALFSASTGSLHMQPVSAAAPAANQVLKWNGANWAAAADANTTYTAGTGLILTTTQFSVNFAGGGSAATVARSDHNHFGQSWSGSAANGLQITNSSTTGRALAGINSAASGVNYGVYGAAQSTSGYGVYGTHSASGSWAGLGGDYEAVYGAHTANNGQLATPLDGVVGYSNTLGGYGVYGIKGTNASHAGYFVGNVTVSGTLSKGGGSFEIDHPLDPENMVLRHSFVESPDMMNVYNGNVSLDDKGEAWIDLPEWFEALNTDYRYQLTAIGGPAPNLHVAQEVHNNRFQIAGGEAGMRISWQVTGIRHDPWAEANRIVVEEYKATDTRGFYLYPELYGRPAHQSMEWALRPEYMQQLEERR